jgi:hypothetical protein
MIWLTEVLSGSICLKESSPWALTVASRSLSRMSDLIERTQGALLVVDVQNNVVGPGSPQALLHLAVHCP